MLEKGDIWRWTIFSKEHPNDPNYNIFLVTDIDEWAVTVLYLADNKKVRYSEDTFIDNKRFLIKVG